MNKRSRYVRTNNSISKNRSKRKKKKADNRPWLEAGLFLFIAIVFAFIYFKCFDTKLNLNGDNASYYLLGKSISLGKGYNLYNDLNALPHNHFPPGYPVILAFLMLFSKSQVFLKLVNGTFLLSSILLSFEVFKKFKIKWQVALVSVLFMTLNYHLLKSSVILMSEIPFLFFSLLNLWWLMHIDFSKDFLKDKLFYAFLFSFAFAFHIRAIGIALLAGVLLYLIFDKKRKAAIAITGGFILLALPWYLRGKFLGLTSSYQTALLKINSYQPELGNVGLIDLANRFGNNLERYITKEIPSGIFPFLEVNYRQSASSSDWMIGGILITLIVFGIYKLPKYRSLMIGYLGGTFIILMLWPSVWRGTRFLMPVIPILIFLIIVSLSTLLEKGISVLKFKNNYAAFLLLPALLLFTQEFKPNKDTNWQSYPLSRLLLESKSGYDSNWKNYIQVAKYVKVKLKDSDIIACRKPQLFYIFSNRFTTLYPFENDDKKLLQILKKKNVKYVIVDQLGFSSTANYLVPAINKNPKHFKQILHLKNPDTYLLEFIPPQ